MHWLENLDRLRDTVIAQAARIRAGSHSTIKGTSLEVVLRRTLREHLPAYFTVGTGQTANNRREVSPQLDVLVYDHVVFPHLAVNEDDSVVVCCEALYGAIECKATWDRTRIKDHFDRFAAVESGRHENYRARDGAASYLVVVFDPCALDASSLCDDFGDDSRLVGIYSVSGTTHWRSEFGSRAFADRDGNGLALLLEDLLLDAMKKGSKDEGTFTVAYNTLRSYFDRSDRPVA